MDHYNKELENNLMNMIKQKEQSDQRLLAVEWVVIFLSVTVLIVPIIVAAHLPMEEWQRLILVFSGLIPAVVGLYFAMKIEQVAGYYVCKACGHRYVPTFKAASCAPHMGRTKYMRCPACHKKSWQKKVLNKE